MRPQDLRSGTRASTCPSHPSPLCYAMLLGAKANTVHLLSLLYYFDLKPNKRTNLELHALKVLFH